MPKPIPCPSGAYSPSTGLTSVSPCNLRYNAGVSLPECIGPAGTYCAGGNQQPIPCSPGYYCIKANMSRPAPCPAGFYCPFTAQTSMPIPCPHGTISEGGAQSCVPCPGGACFNYTCSRGSAPSVSGCQPCAAGSFSDGTVPCTICSPGTYININQSSTCLLCNDTGTVCDSSTGLAYPLPGFWAFVLPNDPLAALHTTPCLQAQLCRGTSSQLSVTQCDSTRMQSADNVECASCASGYSDYNGDCLSCDSVNGGLVFLVILLSQAYVLVTHRLSQSSTGLTSVFFYFVQTALLMAGSAASASAVAWLNFVNIRPQNTASATFCLGPITPLGAVALELAFPFIFLFQLLLSAAVHALIASLSTHKHFAFNPSAYLRTFICLLLYSFTSLTTTTIGFLNCVQIGQFSVVALSPAIDCDSKGYHTLYPVVIAVLVLALVVPVAIAAFLFRHRQQLAKGNAADEFFVSAVLFEMYEPTTFFWQVIVLLRRLAYVACTTVDDQRNRGLAFGVLTMLSSALHYRALPYADANTNRFEYASLTLHALLAYVLTDFPSPSSAPHGPVALIFLIPVPAVLFVLFILVKFYHSRNHAVAKKQRDS